MSADTYRFRSGSPVARTPLGQATDAAYEAGKHLTMATALNGASDWRRDEAIDAARAQLMLALQLIDDATNPTAALTPEQIRRADLVTTMFEICTTGAAA